MKAHILIADDQADIVKLISSNLTQAGFDVSSTGSGKGALALARDQRPSLILLDVMMPDLSGFDVCKSLKHDNATRDIPIILISSRAGEIDRVLGFELGADDYVPKPFSPRELVLRVQSVLRRRAVPRKPRTLLEAGQVTMDLERHHVLVAGSAVELTAIEFKVLRILLEHAGRVQSRDSILRQVWGSDHSIEPRTVDTHMRRLREKLGEAAGCIETVRSFGYRIKD